MRIYAVTTWSAVTKLHKTQWSVESLIFVYVRTWIQELNLALPHWEKVYQLLFVAALCVMLVDCNIFFCDYRVYISEMFNDVLYVDLLWCISYGPPLHGVVDHAIQLEIDLLNGIRTHTYTHVYIWFHAHIYNPHKQPKELSTKTISMLVGSAYLLDIFINKLRQLYALYVNVLKSMTFGLNSAR
jgi:hypothetical protein